MPFPHEHSARVISPDKFEKDSFRSKEISPGIRIIVGKLKGRDTTTAQTYRFDSSKFTAEEAKAWLKRHNIKNIGFERATDKKMEKAIKNIKDKIIAYLTKNPAPADESQFHKFAETVADEHDIAEETAYEILGDLLAGGKSKGKKNKVDPKELAMGIKVELEHTKDKQIAEKIARDHLAEIPDYYTRLKKMESEANKLMKKAYLHVSDNLYIDLTKAIEERKDAPKSVPKEYKGIERKQFADSKNYLYPLDSEKHVRAALSYFGMPRNYQKYEKDERKIIATRIKSAAKKYKIEISEDWLKKFSLIEELKKAKAMPTGTVSKSGKYKKTAEGKWVKITDQRESQKPEENKPKEEKKPEEKPKLDEKNKGTIKNALKKVANILAEALSGKDVVTPTGSAIEETGESIKNKKLEKARTTKYIRRIPKAGGGYTYIYKEIKKNFLNQEENNNKKIDTIIPAIHFSEKKIDKFDIKSRGAIYFLKKPEDFPKESGSFEELKNKYSPEDKDEFDPVSNQGWYYGNYANIVELNTNKNNILDLRKFGKYDKINKYEWLTKNVDEFKNFNAEDDESEIEEMIENFYDSSQELSINKEARKQGYDIVLYDDSSEGTPYTSIAVVNPDIIKNNK